jgi:ferredoxin
VDSDDRPQSPEAIWADVEPAGVRIKILPGESVMEAAVRQGFRWPTLCGGNAECGACVSRVIGGQEGLPRIETTEAQMLARLPRRSEHVMRLACQLRPSAAVTLYKAGVRPVARD